jgi:hypothetical protein
MTHRKGEPMTDHAWIVLGVVLQCVILAVLLLGRWRP